jgi:hypothetical protein
MLFLFFAQTCNSKFFANNVAFCSSHSASHSLGMMMWEMLAGKGPWAGMSEAAILAAVRNGCGVVWCGANLLHAVICIWSLTDTYLRNLA